MLVSHTEVPLEDVEQAFKKIDDILRKDAGVSSEMDYIEQTSWLLFLKYLDALVTCSRKTQPVESGVLS